MCSFLATSWLITNLTYVNFFLRPRGPDHTALTSLYGFSFVHNLLHMTGEWVSQPFIDPQRAVVALYNGEIYNFEALAGSSGRARSDGDVILPMYRKHGVAFPRVLDGEFALAVFDFKKNRAIITTDVFGTKPLWYSMHDGLHVSSYKSALLRLGLPTGSIHIAEPNTIYVFALTAGRSRLLERRALHEFDLRQFKEDSGDFQAAFDRAVLKRARHGVHPSLIGLSSGYDSGAIHAGLVNAGVAHFAYTIYSTEDTDTLARRIEWAGPLVETRVVVLGGGDIEREAGHLGAQCEPYNYHAERGQRLAVAEDPASFGLSYIFRDARRRGILVYLSGSGADEIISDYGHGGKRIFPHSNFGGLFPGDLGPLFPWPSFFLGTQRDYLMKEELVAGVHGIESRYPFLDHRVVQEFLWLTDSAKNAKYKAPVHDWLARFAYPFRSGEKVGFNAAHNVRWDDDRSQVVTYHARAAPGERGENESRGALRDGVEGAFPWPGGSSDEGGAAQRLGAREQELEERERGLSAAEQQLAQQAAQVKAREEAVVEAQRGLEEYEAQLSAQRRQLQTHFVQLQEQQRAQAESALRFMALRLVPIRHLASEPPKVAFNKEPLTAPEDGEGLAAAEPPDVGHPRWSGVEVLTCVSGGRYLNVMDFPVYHIFRASTPLPVHNVCENIEWEGMHMRLRKYMDYLGKRSSRFIDGGREPLFIVSDGMDVIFNDLTEVLDGDPELRGRAPLEGAAWLVIRRYEEILGAGAGRKAIFSSERVCGWGGAHMCSDADLARYPEAPTDSRFLNAGGYIGPASVLMRIIGAVLSIAGRAKQDAGFGDLRAKTTATDAAGGETDQYFFKLHFWEHPDEIALDYHQSIFGNFLEVEGVPCYDGWRPTCAAQPCCTLSDDFKRFHRTFYGSYEVRGCSVWRKGRLPISWHGNGAGKWLWLIALEELTRVCTYVANLTVQQYPIEPIEKLFEEFDQARVLRQHATA